MEAQNRSAPSFVVWVVVWVVGCGVGCGAPKDSSMPSRRLFPFNEFAVRNLIASIPSLEYDRSAQK